jgi:inner membrane protein
VDWLTRVDSTHWLVLALVLLIAELASGTTYLLWPAVAAGITGLIALFFPTSLVVEIGVFAGLTIVLTLLGRPLVRNLKLSLESAPTLNEREKTVIGARAVAMNAFINGAGQVKLGDSVWRAQSADAIAAGQAVEVLSVDGTTVTVKAVG